MGFPQQDMGFSQQDMGFPQQDMGFPQQDMGFPRQDMGFSQQKDVPFVEFMYLVFTITPCGSYRRRLGSLLLCPCDVFRALINRLACWQSKAGFSLQGALFPSTNVTPVQQTVVSYPETRSKGTRAFLLHNTPPASCPHENAQSDTT